MSNSGGSRLQKLLKLIDDASSLETRKAASVQIASIAASHPQQFPYILKEVASRLYHKDWDTRIAASHCLGCLADHFIHHTPHTLQQALLTTIKQEATTTTVKQESNNDDTHVNNNTTDNNNNNNTNNTISSTLSFSSFDIATVLDQGTPLLASGGEEFDLPRTSTSTTTTTNKAERIALQRAALQKRLGLGGFMDSFMDTTELIEDKDLDDDIVVTVVDKKQSNDNNKGSNNKAVQKGAGELLQGMSVRERAMRARALKRAAGASGSGDVNTAMSFDDTNNNRNTKKAKTDTTSTGTNTNTNNTTTTTTTTTTDNNNNTNDDVLESQWQSILSGQWPFQDICDHACMDVLHPRWETRHGASLAMREILRSHASSAAVHAVIDDTAGGWSEPGGSGMLRLAQQQVSKDKKEAEIMNAQSVNSAWLEDCAIHLLCTLALDRLDDFGSDQAVAPVRETAAQALGAVTRPFDSTTILSMLSMLRTLSSSGQWQARHGALQALKYVFAAREHIDEALYTAALPIAMRGLQDRDDDVRAVAAEAMLPAVSLLAVDSSEDACSIRTLLWDSLLTLEELSPAVKGISTLLAAMYTSAATSTSNTTTTNTTAACLTTSNKGHSIDILVQRLWPHMRHTLSSVRLSSVRCFVALLQSLDINILFPTNELLSKAMRIFYQNMLIERNEQVIEQYMHAWRVLMSRTSIDRLMASVCLQGNELNSMAVLACTPAGRRFDTLHLISDNSNTRTIDMDDDDGDDDSSIGGIGSIYSVGVGGSDTLVVDHEGTASMRLRAAQCLGQLGYALSQNNNNSGSSSTNDKHSMEDLLIGLVDSNSVASRVLAGFTCTYWIQEENTNSNTTTTNTTTTTTISSVPARVIERCLQQLTDNIIIEYTEVSGNYTAMRRIATSLITTLQQQHNTTTNTNVTIESITGLPTAIINNISSLTLAHATTLADSITQHSQHINSSEAINMARILKTDAIPKLTASESIAKTTATAALATCVVHSGHLPEKLNPLIQPLMGGTRREPERVLQEHYAHALARLVVDVSSRVPSPSEKMIKNIAVFACGDGGVVPNVISPPSIVDELGLGDSNSNNGRGGDKKGKDGSSSVGVDLVAEAAALTRQGGEAALRSLVTIAGTDLIQRLPALWSSLIQAPLSSLITNNNNTTTPQQLQTVVNAAHILCIIAPAIHPTLLTSTTTTTTTSTILSLLPSLAACLSHPNTAIQLSAARAIAAIASSHPQHSMPSILDTIDPLLSSGASDAARCGGVVCLDLIVSSLGLNMVSYVQLAVVPLLGRMSDSVAATRSIASRCFASVVALIPLAQDAAPPPGLSLKQQESLQKDGGFLQRLLDNRKVEDFTLPFSLLTGTLRPYQKEGINWLAFLRRFGLHGVLADDMGLGKTLQATAIIAATMYEQQQKYKQSQLPADKPRPSLIVCPSTLVAHWPHEVTKFVGNTIIQPLQYHGSSTVRKQLQPRIKDSSLVVLSYESLRADIEWLSTIKWAYCVLDEGHAIRNPSSKIAQAARRIDAQHRLLLSGTPIQNSIQELWALFEFLMPGFLGPQRAFHARFGRAVAASRTSYKKGSTSSSSATSTAAEAGVLALDSLHRQVMPFILRRTKGQVLQDLPPKTVQDVICEPSELQRVLYEDFSASKALEAVTGSMQSSIQSDSTAPPHVFQALHYLRKLCSHPLLVIDHAVPAHMAAIKKVFGAKIASDWQSVKHHLLTDVSHAPKLAVLKELLIDCGIGTADHHQDNNKSLSTADQQLQSADTNAADAGHRALIFAQSRALLDLIETSVLQPLGITSLRIDGSVDAADRFKRVQSFNADPTIEVMLLTTAVGGLGLNLTAADTVIFLEHDWNPQKDLQAMDRAHRLGQKRAVNVYRLLIRGTLEEHIMSLQKFKLDVADAVVNTDNVSLSSMDTGNLLDLLTFREEEVGGSGGNKNKGSGVDRGGVDSVVGVGVGVGGKSGGGGGLAAMLAEMTDPEAAEAQYGEEFDLESFKKKLLGKK